MAKKIVRLTEADLVKLINRVIKEQTAPDPTTFIKECMMEHVKLSDLTKVPTCSAIAMEVVMSKKLPTDIMKGAKCAQELANAVGQDPFTAMGKIASIGECLIEKSKKTGTMY